MIKGDKKIKSTHMKNLILFMSVAVFALAMVSCNRDKNHPGHVFYPDMHYSLPYDTYDDNPVFADSMTNRLPAEGSIPRGYTPYPYKAKSFVDQVNAGLEMMNPLELNDQVLTKGKEQYEIFCMVCHGPQGKGDGIIYTKKLFPAKPTSLVEAYVQNKPDGEIFHVITVGSLSGLMGGHGSQILPENRWKIIHYMRTLSN
jgi:mono/diheme cytochrome c family protein